MEKANKVYDELYEKNKDSLNPEVLFRYSHALKANKNYESADKILSIYLNRTVNTKAFIENLNDIVPYNYDVSKMNSKSSADNFGMSYFGDKVVFASVRNTEDPKYQWNNKPYLDLYEATVSDSSDLEDVKPFPEIINTDSHESNATFSSDGKTMYFSRTNDKRIKINDQKISGRGSRHNCENSNRLKSLRCIYETARLHFIQMPHFIQVFISSNSEFWMK